MQPIEPDAPAVSPLRSGVGPGPLCDATAQLDEREEQITVTCELVAGHDNVWHQDPQYGLWHREPGLADRTRHPGWRK